MGQAAAGPGGLDAAGGAGHLEAEAAAGARAQQLAAAPGVPRVVLKGIKLAGGLKLHYGICFDLLAKLLQQQILHW